MGRFHPLSFWHPPQYGHLDEHKLPIVCCQQSQEGSPEAFFCHLGNDMFMHSFQTQNPQSTLLHHFHRNPHIFHLDHPDIQEGFLPSCPPAIMSSGRVAMPGIIVVLVNYLSTQILPTRRSGKSQSLACWYYNRTK